MSASRKRNNEEQNSINSQKTFKRFTYSDYNIPCFTLAKNLLGVLLCRRHKSGKVLKGTIIETECYPGGFDKASLSFQGKKTEKNTPMYMSPGTAFVYFTYGIYHCFNISSAGKRLVYSDYDVPCVTLAKGLLGLHLCRRLDSGEEVKGMIVETESYLGGDDKGSHSYAGKRTERNAAMYMKPGTAYVYSTYGMYFCLNVSSKGEGAAVLIRALEPTYGIEVLLENRKKNQRKKANNNKDIKLIDICNGPSKLCMSFDINKSLNKEDMVKSEKLWIERPLNYSLDNRNDEIIACSRIGIEYAGKEWSTKPLRFYIRGNQCVSKRDKIAEMSLNSE